MLNTVLAKLSLVQPCLQLILRVPMLFIIINCMKDGVFIDLLFSLNAIHFMHLDTGQLWLRKYALGKTEKSSCQCHAKTEANYITGIEACGNHIF